MPGKFSTYKFIVDSFDTDFRSMLSISVLGKRILSCATLHARERGFDKLTHNGVPYLWVLSRLIIQMDKWPKEHEEYNITTWVGNYYRQFTDRYFSICDAEGNCIGRVMTIWTMINSATRLPATIKELFADQFDKYIENETPCNIGKGQNYRNCKGLSTKENKIIVNYSDLDLNGHLNSIRYIDYAMNTFPIEFHCKNNVERIEMHYCKEGHYGEELTTSIIEADNTHYFGHIVNPESNLEICKFQIEFKQQFN